MSTIADLEVRQLELHLRAGGFLGAFTDINSNPQPAPVYQSFELDLTNLNKTPKNSRVVMIRTTGTLNSANRFFFKDSQPMLVLVVGQATQKDSIIAQGLAVDIEKYLTENPTDGACLANIESSGVTGPFITADGRRAYEINVSVSFNV